MISSDSKILMGGRNLSLDLNAVKLADVVRDSGVGFGTSGARGLVNKLTDEVCAAYTHAFLSVIAQSFDFKRVALGIDLRPSSPVIAGYCANAIENAGFEVDYCGTLPTPALALYAQTQNIPAIMVTGSHIPFDRNGLKFYRPDGEITKADETAMLAMQVALSATDYPYDLPRVNPQALANYEARYVDFFPAGILNGLHIGVYEHSSVARDPLKSVLEQLGATVVSLGRTDVFVPIDTEAVSPEDVELGRAWSEEYGFDAIISTDGDGDRPLIGDESGRWLRGDIVGLLCARYLDINTLAVPVSCNTAIEESDAFDQVVRTRIGSPYVIAAMQELDTGDSNIAGFEANGGFLLGSAVTKESNTLVALPTRDAVLPILAVLAAAQQSKVSLSALASGLPERYTASDRLQNFPTEISKKLISEWANDSAVFSALLDDQYGLPVMQDTTDGLRLTFDSGAIIHLRPSGNAPEFRCYSEASSPGVAEKITQNVLSRIKELQQLK